MPPLHESPFVNVKRDLAREIALSDYQKHSDCTFRRLKEWSNLERLD